jgi:hypothetical protein
MIITRSEPSSGSADRTPREEIKPLITGTRGFEPEQYPDSSPSEGWPWKSNSQVNTWTIQRQSMKSFTEPFAALDTEAKNETEAGGVATYPFSDRYLPLSDKKDEDGDLIIDVNPFNFDGRIDYFMRLHSDHFQGGLPQYGGTELRTALIAGDEHFMDEFGHLARGQRPGRGRVFWTDGMLQDAQAVLDYLAQATAVDDPKASDVTPIGRHGDWDEIILACILGEEGSDSHQAYEQYAQFAKSHPWIHPLFFTGVINGAEIAEDAAIAVVPVNA